MLDRYKPPSSVLLFSILYRSPAHVNRSRQEHACDIITICDAGQKDVVRNKKNLIISYSFSLPVFAVIYTASPTVTDSQICILESFNHLYCS